MTEREIFFEALEMDTPESRAAYLKGACAGDVALQRKVEQLLREHFSNDSLIAGSALAVDRPGIVKSPVEEAPAQMIGRYKLLEKIGEGGFGEVWMAEQREPVKRRVALKILKPGMDSRQVVARFEAERQALALMDHANIARIFDAGVTDNGRPYFVMELVRGMKITDYCDQNQLPTEERLKLFTLVCHAIQHAHQKGIIHRDIKPSNILVTLHDGVPVPKVIDFGIAKATQQELTDKTLFTQFQQFIGTPAYISPEQAEMSGLDIDTRADIYSLGVLLYELLVGQTPFDAKEMIQGGLDALRRIIREKEPPRPSTKLNTLQGEARTTAGKRRQTDVGRLVHQLQGDLDWIVMKCLEKDRQRRYETANGLATDIQRHMNNEPVLARPPSKLYEFQKTVKRHKIGFAAAGGVILALAIGLGIATWTLIKEKRARARADNAEQEQKRQRQIAETKEKKSQQVAQFLKDMLNGVGPSVALGRDTKLLKEILDQTAERVGKDLTNQPEVEAELRSTMGDVYQELREYQKAEAMHRAALAIRRKLWGDENAGVAASLEGVGRALWKERRATDARSVLRESLAIRRKVLGNNHRTVASSLNSLGRVANNSAEAESYYQEALAILRGKGNSDRTAVAETLKNLAGVKTKLGKQQEAEDAVREALALLKDQPSTGYANALSTLGVVLHAQGKLPEAETTLRNSLALLRQIFGNESPELGYTIRRLAGLLASAGRLEEAESFYLESARLWLASAARGDLESQVDLRGSAEPMRQLASRFQSQGKDERAADLRQEATKIWQTSLNYAENGAPSLQRNLGWDYASGKGMERDLVQAAKWYRKAAEQGDSYAQNALGRMYEQGQGVAKDFGAALEWYRRAAGNEYSTAQFNLGRMYSSGKGIAKDEAEAFRWFRKAADQGLTEAQLEVGLRYNRGQGIERNEVEAAKWLQKVSTSENPLALNNVAWEWATSPDEGLRNGTNAVAFAEKAVAATSRTNTIYLDTLAAAYAETGDFQKAISVQREAMALVTDEEQKRDGYEDRLKLYQSDTPYREK